MNHNFANKLMKGIQAALDDLLKARAATGDYLIVADVQVNPVKVAAKDLLKKQVKRKKK